MYRSPIETGNLAIDLTPRPIEPSWIIEGNPLAQCGVLSQEGSIVLESDDMPPTRYGAGDVVFFRDGAHARWHVEGRVKKLAFCRKTQPVLLGLALRVFSKIRRTLMPSGKRQPASLMVSG